MKALIATQNQGKIQSAKQALELYFNDVEVIGIPVKSNVSDMPVNDEISEGAKNRLENLKKYSKENGIKADMYMSIESGINKISLGWVISNIAIIENEEGLASYGVGPQFPVPEKYVKEIVHTGLNQVMNRIFGEDEQRHNKGGGIQILTHGNITRIDLSRMAFIMALTTFINDEQWK